MTCPKAAYSGYLQVGGQLLPYLSASFSKRQEVINSKPISNGATNESRSVYNYSLGKKIVEGNFSIEVFGGSNAYGSAFRTLVGYALTNACNGMSDGSGGGGILFSPAGGTSVSIPGSGGKAVINSMEIKGNNGGIVTASFGLMATNHTWGSSSAIAASSLIFESVGASEDNNPLAYYNSNFVITGSGETSNITDFITDWSITVSNNVDPVYTLCTENDREAADLRLGALIVNGSFSYYSPTAVWSENLKNGAGLSLGLGALTLSSSNVIFVNEVLPVGGPNQVVARQVNFQCMGHNDKAALYV